MITASEGLGALSYNGWKIFTWRFYHSDPDLRPVRISIQELFDRIKELFEGAEWVFQVESLESGLASLAHIPMKYDVRVEVHGEELPIEYTDSLDVRNIILKLSAAEAQKLGIVKSTLHYLRKNAGNNRPFKVYQKAAQRLNSGTSSL